MARLLGKAELSPPPEQAQMAQLPNEAQMAWPAADRTMKASENKEFNSNASVQIYTSDADTSKGYVKWVHANTVYEWVVCQICSTQVVYRCS